MEGEQCQCYWVVRGCVGAKYVIEMNMKHRTYLSDAVCQESGAGQQGVCPGRGMLHDWPCKVVCGGCLASWNGGFGSPAYCSGMSFPF